MTNAKYYSVIVCVPFQRRFDCVRARMAGRLLPVLLHLLAATAAAIVGRPCHGLPTSPRSALHTLRACSTPSRKEAAPSGCSGAPCSGASSSPGPSHPQVPNTFTVPEDFVQKHVQLPRLGVGTQSWGDPQRGWGLSFNETDIEAAYDTLSVGGIRFFDTSEMYGYQNVRLCEGSEQLIGAMAARYTPTPALPLPTAPSTPLPPALIPPIPPTPRPPPLTPPAPPPTPSPNPPPSQVNPTTPHLDQVHAGSLGQSTGRGRTPRRPCRHQSLTTLPSLAPHPV